MTGSEGVAKVSISLPGALASAVRRHAGPRGLSSFAARAMRHELERDLLAAFLDQLAEEIGSPDEGLIAEIDAQWPDI